MAACARALPVAFARDPGWGDAAISLEPSAVGVGIGKSDPQQLPLANATQDYRYALLVPDPREFLVHPSVASLSNKAPRW